MALKLPGAEDLGGPVSGRSGRPIASLDTSAIGRGVVQAGQGMRALSAGLKVREQTQKKQVDQSTAFDTQSRYLQFEDQQRKAFADSILKAPVGADGFTAGQKDSYRKAAKEFFKTVPDDLKPDYNETLFKLESSITSKADAFAVEEKDRVAKAKIDDGQNVILQGLQDNPDGWKDADAQAEALVKNSGRTPIDQDMQLRDWRKRRAEALWDIDSRTNGGAARERLGVGGAVQTVVGNIIGAESGGNPNAKNPNSSASGVGQFTDSTWLATVRRHRPDLAGKSNGELLALKNNSALGREMTTRLTEDNQASLASSGMPTTAGNLYLAHFAGIGGAKALLRADDSQSVASVLGPEVMKANGFLNGMSVGDIKAWAAKKMGGSHTEVAPQYADLPYEDRVKLYDHSVVEEQQAANAAAVQLKAQQASFKDALSLGIETGTVVSQQEILSANIDDGDKATLLKALNTKLKEEGGVSALTASIVAGSPEASINSFDEDQRKVADKTYDAMQKAVPDEQKGVVTDAFVQATGYIPQPVQAVVRQGAASTDPGILAAAMSQADVLQIAAPVSFDSFAGGSDVRTKLTDFRHFVNDLGMSGQDAAAEMLRRSDPAVKVNREVLKPEADKFVKTLSVAQVTDAFDPGVFSAEPGAGIMPEQSSALLAEYKEIAESAFYATGGDSGLAQARALAEIKTRWNVSNISGSANLMRLPPEQHYPAIGGSFDYLRTDAMETASKFAEGLGRKVENVAIWPTAQTRADIEMGRAPRYRLFYQYSEDGQTKFDEVLGKGWGVDAKSLQKSRDADKTKFLRTHERDDAANQIERDANARAEKALEETPGPDWMKARAAEAERERGKVQADTFRATPDAVLSDEPQKPQLGDDPEVARRLRGISTTTQEGQF